MSGLSTNKVSFRWDDPTGYQAQVRAELDAYYASLYGHTVRN
jgi:hypothetical protein